MGEMEDRVARAIWQRMDPGNTEKNWDRQPGNVKELPRELARAALASMVEPTESMVEVGQFERDTGGSVQEQWETMIKAAMDENLNVVDLEAARSKAKADLDRWNDVILDENTFSMSRRAGR